MKTPEQKARHAITEKADDSEIGELPCPEPEANDDIEIGDAW